MKSLLYYFLCIYFLLSAINSDSQIPVVAIWDKKFGGIDYDFLSCFFNTRDGGFVLAGTSNSYAGGNKSESTKGGYDYWIVRLDPSGNMLWNKDFGGTSEDWLFSVQETSDKGFILGGTSQSGISGNKTQPLLDTTSAPQTYRADYWIIKIDSSGNIEWDKTFGGYDTDQLSSVYETSDKGYILGGTSYSENNGDKTEPLKDTGQAFNRMDYWIIKIDSAGNKQWDKDYGGVSMEELSSIVQTPDDGFLLAGHSYSGIGGDKTLPNFGWWDIWMIKTDAAGTILWDKEFGGSEYDYQPKLFPDSGEYIVGCTSASGMSGNKTTSSWSLSMDYWIFKIDSLGNKLWEVDCGGTGPEEFHSVSRTYDGGYILSGDSYSFSPGGDKTQSNYHSEETWIIKLDSLRNKEWDKTFQTLALLDDETGMALQTPDGCFYIANCSASYPGGDNTQQNWDPDNDYNDFWMIKMCDSSFLLPTAYFMSSNFACPGACLFFQNLSQNATFYDWSFPGANPSSSTDANPQNICYINPGVYDVRLIAGNANTTDTLLLPNYITVFPTPPPQGIIQSGDTLFANQGASGYQWYYEGNIINGATNYFYIATASGNYNLIAIDAHNCEVEAVINNVLAHEQSAAGSWQMAIFPNPAQNQFTIHNAQFRSGTADEISIYNILGKKVMVVDYGLNQDNQMMTVDCRELPAGLYYLEIDAGEKIYRTKFVKQ